MNFDKVAEKYFKAWFGGDRLICQDLADSNENAKLAALARAAGPSGRGTGYGIARTLWTRFDVEKGLKRYEPVLRILESVRREQFESGKLVAAVNIPDHHL